MIKYKNQAEANIESFLCEDQYLERKEKFFQILDCFEKNNIRFGVACSMNLFLRGITDDFHDFDFIVDQEDIPKIMEIMNGLNGDLVATGGNGFCESNEYLHYQLGRVDVDIIAGFRLLTFGTSYMYAYNAEQIDVVSVENVDVPLIALEALFVLYAMMEGWQPRRKYKRKLIYKYLIDNGISYKQILISAMAGALPKWVKDKIKMLLA